VADAAETETPTATGEQPGQKPDAGEGQNPDGGEQPVAEEPQGRTYSEAYVKQLRNENAKHRNENEELKEKLQEREDADKSELERTVAERDRLKGEVERRQMLDLRIEVAASHGLGLDTLQFLHGSTREEIELRAEELTKLLGEKPKPTTAGFDGGARKTAEQRKSPEEEHNDFLLRAFGRQPT